MKDIDAEVVYADLARFKRKVYFICGSVVTLLLFLGCSFRFLNACSEKYAQKQEEEIRFHFILKNATHLSNEQKRVILKMVKAPSSWQSVGYAQSEISIKSLFPANFCTCIISELLLNVK